MLVAAYEMQISCRRSSYRPYKSTLPLPGHRERRAPTEPDLFEKDSALAALAVALTSKPGRLESAVYGPAGELNGQCLRTPPPNDDLVEHYHARPSPKAVPGPNAVGHDYDRGHVLLHLAKHPRRSLCKEIQSASETLSVEGTVCDCQRYQLYPMSRRRCRTPHHPGNEGLDHHQAESCPCAYQSAQRARKPVEPDLEGHMLVVQPPNDLGTRAVRKSKRHDASRGHRSYSGSGFAAGLGFGRRPGS
jgi:hypothetical protein